MDAFEKLLQHADDEQEDRVTGTFTEDSLPPADESLPLAEKQEESLYQCVRTIWLPADDTHFKKAIEETGSYMPERIQAAMSYCSQTQLALDVGAHVGIYTREMAQRFTEVYAFEPNPVSFTCLQRNTADLRNRIYLSPWALGKEEGYGTLHVDPFIKRLGNSGARFIVADPEGTIPVKTIDSLALPACDFIKIDVEGMELDVLQGGEQTIVRYHPVIMLEIGKVPEERYQREAEEPLRFLSHLGMSLVLEMRGDKVCIWK